MDDFHLVINFFEQVQKPPEQDSYLDGMKYIFDYVKKQPSFLLGQLHKNNDPSGHYPYVNYAGFGNGDFPVFQKGPPPQEWIQVITKGIGPLESQMCYPGGYRELGTLSGNPMVTMTPSDESSSYLLINYKESDIGEANFNDFEADWKAKTGATILTWLLQGDVKYGEIGFYKRITGRTPFIFVLRCEVLPGSSTESVLEQLPMIREKLGAANVPFNNISAYNVCYLCTPKS